MKGGVIVAHRVRDRVEVRDGDPDCLGEGAVSAEDAHDRARRAVAAEVLGAGGADAAGKVDLGGDALALPERWTIKDAAEELVAEDALIGHVAFGDLEIGVADAGPDHPEEGCAGGGGGRRAILEAGLRSAVEVEGAHLTGIAEPASERR